MKRYRDRVFCTANHYAVKKNVNVLYLPTKHQRAQATRSKVSVPSGSNWNLKMLVFVEGGTGEPREKTLGTRTRTNDKLWRRVRESNPATLVGGKCSHHCAIPAPLVLYSRDFWNSKRKSGVTMHSEERLNIQSNVWNLVPNWKFIISEKCVITPNFQFGSQ